MIATVTNQGKVRFMIYRDSMNAQRLIKFLGQLIKGADRRLFLILNNLRVDHSKWVKKWLQKHANQIELFYLPGYSPELNPDEYLNGDIKAGVHLKPPSSAQEALKKKAFSHMKKLQKMPERVEQYFKHPRISSAA